jgi:hypothetical protein
VQASNPTAFVNAFQLGSKPAQVPDLNEVIALLGSLPKLSVLLPPAPAQ